MARRNSRVGGTSSWRSAASDSVSYRPVAAKVRSRDLAQGESVIPTFSSDEERYGWEMEQWRSHGITTKRYWRKWQGSDGLWHIGPPFYPGAPVYEHEKAIRAFKLANKDGYITPRTLGEELGFGRYKAKRLIDAVTGVLDVGYATYFGKGMPSTKFNCRMVHEDCVDDIGKNEKIYMDRLRTLVKARAIPGAGNLCREFLAKDGETLR